MGGCFNRLNSFRFAQMKQDKDIKVNLCYELNKERKCQTLSKEDAYTTRKWVEGEGGFVWWFNPI